MIIKNEWKKYDTELSDKQWEIIEPLFGKPGNKSKWEKRELVNAVLYLVNSGCKWRQLPHDFPTYTTVCRHPGVVRFIKIEFAKEKFKAYAELQQLGQLHQET